MSAEPMCSPSHLDGHMFVGDADVCRCGAARLVPADPAPPVSETAAWTNAEIRRQRDAWRDYAEHLDHCVECSQMGEIGDCFDRKTLQEATTCQRCGGSARAQPNIEWTAPLSARDSAWLPASRRCEHSSR